jgi:hypothetical protein
LTKENIMAEMDYAYEGPPTDLAIIGADGEIAERPKNVLATPAQAKNDAIAAVTMAAYAKASELKLTPEEGKALQADFPNEAFRPGAGGNQTLIYLEHAYLRDRFNEVLGLGQWSLITRSQWTEDFTTPKNVAGVRVYAQVMLMIRGCYVAEATNTMEYYPSNANTSYADAIQGSKTAAFRRCAADFGVGLQAYKKGWCESWWAWKNNGARPARPQEQQAPANPPVPDPLLKLANETAKQGVAALQLFWEKTLTKAQRVLLKDHIARLKSDALAATPNRGDAFEGGPEPD